MLFYLQIWSDVPPEFTFYCLADLLSLFNRTQQRNIMSANWANLSMTSEENDRWVYRVYFNSEYLSVQITMLSQLYRILQCFFKKLQTFWRMNFIIFFFW